METTDKIPVTITEKERAKIYANYGFSEAKLAIPANRIRKDWGIGEYLGRYHWCDNYGRLHESIENCRLYLKPLGEISDEDAAEIIKILDKIGGQAMPLKEVKNVCLCLQPHIWPLQVCDYLRSKGYAMPYMTYSVEQLVEAGIYKLTN